ncbi:hypothetical protein C2845_PM01G34060 [Panicum miliaceum]|uniref:Uncharacterized protein n=1 Tax=Panicum miliaceum TaxID=4540 RepID=A0A3L6TKX1_PANMI|nr:hypothetical protein C2845_PM01G34060 [Panicum miliaceum]
MDHFDGDNFNVGAYNGAADANPTDDDGSGNDARLGTSLRIPIPGSPVAGRRSSPTRVNPTRGLWCTPTVNPALFKAILKIIHSDSAMDLFIDTDDAGRILILQEYVGVDN